MIYKLPVEPSTIRRATEFTSPINSPRPTDFDEEAAGETSPFSTPLLSYLAIPTGQLVTGTQLGNLVPYIFCNPFIFSTRPDRIIIQKAKLPITMPQKSYRYEILVFLFAAMGGVLYGYDIGIISGALLFIHQDIPMSHQQESFLVASVLGGGAFSTLLSGYLADIFGRRRMISFAALIFMLGVMLVVFATSFMSIFAGRLVQGVGVGIVTIVVPLYLAESVPTRLRGRGITIFQLLLTVGILIATLVDFALTKSGNWRLMFISALVPGAVMFIGSFWLTDSPRWLCLKGRFDEALVVLTKTRYPDEAKFELAQMKASLNKRIQRSSSFLSALKDKKNVLALSVVLMVAILAQLTGINTWLQFSAVMLKTMGLSHNESAMFGSTLITCLNVAMTAIALMLVDKIGRRPLLCVGTLGTALSLILMAIVAHLLSPSPLKGELMLGGLLLFILFFAVGPGVLIWVMISELLPSNIRSRGMAVALFLNSLTSTLLASVFLKLVDHIGFGGVFMMCGGFSFIYFLVAYRFIPETKGKTLEEIEIKFSKDNCVAIDKAKITC